MFGRSTAGGQVLWHRRCATDTRRYAGENHRQPQQPRTLGDVKQVEAGYIPGFAAFVEPLTLCSAMLVISTAARQLMLKVTRPWESE